MTDDQKMEILKALIVSALLPMEIESELMAFVQAKKPEEAVINNFAAGAEWMRRAAIGKLLELEDGCLGIQKASFVVSRNAIECLEVP